MTAQFFFATILKSLYVAPGRHWELDESGQPTQRIADGRRKASFVTPIPKAKKQGKAQASLALDEGHGLTTADQLYLRSLINELRVHVERWRVSRIRTTGESRRKRGACCSTGVRTHSAVSVRSFVRLKRSKRSSG